VQDETAAGTNALELVEKMVDALNDHVIDGQERFWVEDMKWYGPAGIGTKASLRSFQDEHQRAFLHAFPDKYADDEIRFGVGQWAAATGYQYATHAGDYLGIPATGKKVKIRYMDIWRAEGDKLVENWVLIDLVDFLEQIGIDVLQLVRDKIASGEIVLDGAEPQSP
jgi:predicted ester cyclase